MYLGVSISVLADLTGQDVPVDVLYDVRLGAGASGAGVLLVPVRGAAHAPVAAGTGTASTVVMLLMSARCTSVQMCSATLRPTIAGGDESGTGRQQTRGMLK